MEPKILLIGRRQEVVDVLLVELKKFQREVSGASEQEKIEQLVNSQPFDFVVIGPGLPDHQRDYLTSFIQTLKPEIPVHLVKRKFKNNPYKLISFINSKAIEFKIERLLAEKKV